MRLTQRARRAFALWGELAPGHRWLVWDAGIRLAWTAANLRARGVEWALAVADREVSGSSRACATDLARVVDFASRLMPGLATCLVRSTVLCSMLRRRGFDARLRIGVTLAQDQLGAHAWVCVGDLVLDGAGEARTAEFAAFDLAPSREGRR